MLDLTLSDSSLLRRPAPVVRNGCDVLEVPDLNAGRLNRTDGGLTAGTRTLDTHVAIPHPELIPGSGSGTMSRLRCSKGCALTTSAEPLSTGAGMGENVAIQIADTDEGIVKSRFDVSDTVDHGSTLLLLLFASALSIFSHGSSFLSPPASADSGFLGSLSGSSIRMGALAPDRQSAAMSKTPIAPDVHQALDIQLYFLAKISFDPPLILDDLADRGALFLREFTHLHSTFDVCLLQNSGRPSMADSVNIGQADVNSLAVRNVDSSNACHTLVLTLLSPALSLPLFVLGVGTDHAHHTAAANDPTIHTNFLY